MLQAEHMNIPSPFGGSFRTRVAGQCLDIVPGLELPRRGKPSWRSAPDALAEIAQLCGYLPLAPCASPERGWCPGRPGRSRGWPLGFQDESRWIDLLKAGDLEVRASFALSYQGRSQGASMRSAGEGPIRSSSTSAASTTACCAAPGCATEVTALMTVLPRYAASV